MGLYEAIRFFGFPLRYRVIGMQSYTGGPAVFVANHLGSAGPIRLVFSSSIRFYPWVIAEMMDLRMAPGYLYADFVSPELGLTGRSGRAVSWILAQIAVRLLAAVGCIPVEKGNHGSAAAFRQSRNILASGGVLLIFPEDPALSPEPVSRLRPFQHGFIGLGHMHARSGPPLPFYPVAVIPHRRLIRVGAPRLLQIERYDRNAVREFRFVLEQEVRRLYLQDPG